MVPGAAALHGHPKNVYLPEALVLDALNAWLGGLFDRDNVDRTVAALVASQGATGMPTGQDAARKRAAEAETRLRRLQAAVEAGADPAALVEALNKAQAQRAAARAELAGAPAPDTLTEAEVYAIVDYLGDLGRGLTKADAGRLEELYSQLRLEMTYHPDERAVDVAIRPARRGSARVRGGT